MQCLILAGGRGTRMKPFTDRLPKTLIPVNGIPFAHYQLDWLSRHGVERVIYSIGHMADKIRDFVGDGSRWRLDITCVDEGEKLLGTAGAIRLAIDQGLMADGFFVIYGDSYLPVELAPVWQASKKGAVPLMTVYRNDGRWDESNVIFENGRVVLYEKGRKDAAAIGMRHIDYGLSVLTREAIVAAIGGGETADLALVFNRLSRAGGLLGREVGERFYEVGSPQGLVDLQAHLSSPERGREGSRSPG
ncbi:MAG: NTP transferase domain-containing protein [Rhodospirillales bacterium]|jgi:NDP-sugar pyrophosphorylase family protein|nr:NTP transferase domain-containing protein [Rhodospirillales bacterium]HIJ43382.1 NTP transferase domain-containing protein [Rhodospirillaceae bacterium]MDP7098459.1 NTP transferase domain-containing protein [Rhodospirillales bacterium]MDP7215273.1 NTP transferase domain-containing protein [Rhodospirillales bacterium]HIJ46145.1 NTP transferase domain-containing protein [Rhodospirillaceae bacterium]